MQKFSEFVNDYRKYLKANGMDSNVSPDQVKRIRELYESLNTKKSKIKESEDSDPNKAEDGDGTCECGDPNCDGEECKGDEKIEESKSFQEMLAKYREWKFKTKGTRGVTMREKPGGEYRFSVRSCDEIDASEICRNFGGGGHRAAAGCSINKDMETAFAEMLEVCIKAVEETL